MVEIMNRLNQPLILNFDNGGSKHLLAKEKVEITMEQFKSVEVKLHVEAKDLLVLRMS